MSEKPTTAGVVKPARPGFEKNTSVVSLGWIGTTVECRPDGGYYDERGHFGKVVAADDRPTVGYPDKAWRGEWGWFVFVDEENPGGITLHSSEVYPPLRIGSGKSNEKSHGD